MKKILNIDGVTVGIVFSALIFVFMLTAPRAFLNFRVYMSFFAIVPPPLIIALGIILVAVAGEMDLSFPSTVCKTTSRYVIFCRCRSTHALSFVF